MNKNERLKTARERAGLKQEDLAEKMGVSQSYIGSLEKNKSYSIEKAKEISSFLNVDWKWLYFGDTETNGNTSKKLNRIQDNVIEYLKLLLEEKEKTIINNEKSIADKEEIIKLLKEKLRMKSGDEEGISKPPVRNK